MTCSRFEVELGEVFLKLGALAVPFQVSEDV